jgi:hypothetical protein
MPRCSLSVYHVILMWACSMSSGKEVPRWRFSMIRVYLQWQELAWDPKSSSMRFGYSYFTGHEVFNFWFVRHMLIIVLALTLTIQDAYDGGNESSKLLSTIIFWRFIKLAITASFYEGPFFYFYVESPPSTFMHRIREHSCHSEFNMHSPKVYHWLIHDYGFTCSLIICI